jgi:DNA-binding beta-propeller fold protein YncE
MLALMFASPASVCYGADGDDPAQNENTGPVFYPGDPEPPRIQFLRMLSSDKDVKPEISGFRKFILGTVDAEIMIDRPYGVEFHDGKVFVCDTGQSYVAIFDIKGKSFGSLGRTSSGKLKKPINITIDADGTRYVTDTGHKRIMVYDAENNYKRSIGDPETMGPTDVAILGDKLYVVDVDNGQVVIMDKRNGDELQRIGNKGSKEGELFFPTNVAVDPDGNVFVVDTGNARVVKFDSRGEFAMQIGQLGDTPGSFTRPKGIALDKKGNIYVVDSAFENVQLFDRDGTLLMYFGSGNDIPGGLSLPAQITIDYDNVEYFKDQVAPGHELEYLLAVTCQYAINKINIYGFLKTDE